MVLTPTGHAPTGEFDIFEPHVASAYDNSYPACAHAQQGGKAIGLIVVCRLSA